MSMYVDGRRQNYSYRPDPEEEDWAVPQRATLRDVQCGDYVIMYMGKERNRSIAQVGTLTNALLVQCMYRIKFKSQ